MVSISVVDECNENARASSYRKVHQPNSLQADNRNREQREIDDRRAAIRFRRSKTQFSNCKDLLQKKHSRQIAIEGKKCMDKMIAGNNPLI